MAKPSPANEYWFIFQKDRLLIFNFDTHPQLLTGDTIIHLKEYIVKHHRLAHIESVDIYCSEIADDFALPDNIAAVPLRKALEIVGPDWYTLAVKAYTIINWDKNHRFCGRCGQPTEPKSDTFERYCTTCGLSFFPRISPSIIVLIHRGDEVLMARGHHFTPGAYGLIAGFVEGGETLEDAVHREVKEEVGITIKQLHYFNSQAWPFPDSLMIGFIAEYASGELVINHNEIEAAGWYRYDQLPGRPASKLSISWKLIDHFVAEQKQKSVR